MSAGWWTRALRAGHAVPHCPSSCLHHCSSCGPPQSLPVHPWRRGVTFLRLSMWGCSHHGPRLQPTVLDLVAVCHASLPCCAPHMRLCSTLGGSHAWAPSVLTWHRASCDAQTGEQPLATDHVLRSQSWPAPVLPTSLRPRSAWQMTREVVREQRSLCHPRTQACPKRAPPLPLRSIHPGQAAAVMRLGGRSGGRPGTGWVRCYLAAGCLVS